MKPLSMPLSWLGCRGTRGAPSNVWRLTSASSARVFTCAAGNQNSISTWIAPSSVGHTGEAPGRCCCNGQGVRSQWPSQSRSGCVRHFVRFIAHPCKALSAGPFQQAVQKAAGPGTAREWMQPARDRVAASVWRRGGHRRRGQGQRGIGLALGIDVLSGAARAAIEQGHRYHACRTRVITSSQVDGAAGLAKTRPGGQQRGVAGDPPGLGRCGRQRRLGPRLR